MTDYKTNIQKLRAGTALSSAEFIETIRARHADELGLDVPIIHLDYSVYDDVGFQKEYEEKQPSVFEEKLAALKGENYTPETKDAIYTAATRQALQDDINTQFKQFEKEEIYQEYFENELGYNKGLQNNILQDLENNKPCQRTHEHEGEPISIIVHERDSVTMLDELCDITNWNPEDVKYTSSINPQLAINTADHEIGHACLAKYLERDMPIPDHKDEDYNAHIHECFADVYAAVSAIYDGESKEHVDQIALERTYNAVVYTKGSDGEEKLGYIHFTSPTLAHIKDRLNEETIRELPNKLAMGGYVADLVLGDNDAGQDPGYMSHEAFLEAKRDAQSVATIIQNFCNNGERPVPTPRQFQEILKTDRHLFDDNEIEFMERYIVPHTKTMLHAHDVNLELTSKERFDNPELMDESHSQIDLFNKVPENDFEEHIQEIIFPINENEDVIDLSAEEQLERLNLEKRFISRGGEIVGGLDEQAALDVITLYEDTLHQQLDNEYERSHIEMDKRAQEIVTRDDDMMY